MTSFIPQALSQTATMAFEAAKSHPYIAGGLAAFAAYQSGIFSSAISSATTSATATAESAVKSGLKNWGYRKLSDYIAEHENEIRTNHPHLIADQSNGLGALFAKNKEFQAACKSFFSTQASIDQKFDELFECIKSAKFYIQGYSIYQDEQEPTPSAEDLDALHRQAVEAPVQAAEPAHVDEQQLNRELQRELKKFTTCLRRKLEIQSILGDNATQDLNNAINGSSEEHFQTEFKKAIKQMISRSSTPAFLRRIRYAFIICCKFFLGIFTKSLLNKINKFLDKSLNEFISQDKTKIMDAIANILCSGLHLYTNEVINAAHELANKGAVDGTPEMMFESILSKKTSLHKGMSQKDFYLHALDQILKYCFDWSISRWVVKQLVKASGYLDNPFLSLPKNIRHANGYFYNIDKAIVRFINPIIQKMSESGSGASGDRDAQANPIRAYSNLNRDTLKKSIESLFEATDIFRAPNLSEIKKVVDRSNSSNKNKSILESVGLNTDAILKQTAEAGATSLLESISDILSSRFLKENAISSLKSLNAVFSSSEEISDNQYQAAERERKDSLNRLTRIIITNAVDHSPILNTTEIVRKMNAEILKSKTLGISIKDRLEEYTQNPLPMSAIYPADLIEDILEELQVLKLELDVAAQSGKYSEDQINDIFAPYNTLKSHVAEFQKAYIQKPGQAASLPLQIAQAAQAKVQDLKVALKKEYFATRDNLSIMDNPKVKELSKHVLNFMLRQKFNQAYEFICDFKTIKYCVIHQGVLAAL